jgi:serine protease AprX
VDAPEWNISKIHAPEVWAQGFQGQGITIGGQDTGYAWQHPALINQYRGWDGESVDHNYNWHDAIHQSSGNPCGSDSQEPCDDHQLGHGTHTMGTMVGQETDLSNQIGVAPQAKWIGCRNMDQGVGSPATYIECYQWFLAPTDLNDQNPDPLKAPDVINNSWSCPVSEGCSDPLVLQTVVEAVRAAGILTVHSAGNSGPICSSINTPSAIYDASFTVGNTDRYDQISLSSSRGPVTIDGSGRIKPDVSAPGTGIRSSLPGGRYGTLSGTSMAGPHVAGLAALLYSAHPELIGQVGQLERLITASAVPVSSNSQCGAIPDTSFPNNSSGWGRVDAVNGLLHAENQFFFSLAIWD